ncbi:hypothetical protein SAMN06296020_12518 [Anoxynatronum buryatiense]|uniref:HNH nuclease domain-containing protein n=2 Tax=Anoxynatronum buryatiense TaxID=489973 RepID=A0AA46AKP6_9CLOT|nr:hypothetical protein SAMN06296020_12518 [Anoxynatronum buryatiense]
MLSEYCIYWPGFLDRDGYGQISSNKDGTLRPTRLILSQKLGRDIRKGCVAHHTCYNKQCVNPLHITEVTIKENKRDSKYQDHPNLPVIELTKEDVFLIRYVYNHHNLDGYSDTERRELLKKLVEIKVSAGVSPIPVPDFVINVIIEYKSWDYIHLPKIDRLPALHRLCELIGDKSCVFPDWIGDVSKPTSVQKNNITTSAHRKSLALFYLNDISTEKVVMHSCDKPKCINPYHLSPNVNEFLSHVLMNF